MVDRNSIAFSMGAFIAERRKHLGLSLDEVARRAGCTKSHIWDLEQGKARNPTISTALALCGALQCSLNSLLGMDVSQPIISDDELSLIMAHRKLFGASNG